MSECAKRLLTAIVDIQDYIKHDIDKDRCAACPRWDELQSSAMDAIGEIERLRKENAELLDALRQIANRGMPVQKEEHRIARVAIAKARGEE